jgi:ribonuclease-3
VEALLAAVHEDAGSQGFTAVLGICEGRFLDSIRAATRDDWKQRDAKTALQERAAVLGLPAPSYGLQSRSGPDHAPCFLVDAEVGVHRSQGQGTTRKAAEADAARALLGLIGE